MLEYAHPVLFIFGSVYFGKYEAQKRIVHAWFCMTAEQQAYSCSAVTGRMDGLAGL